MPELTPLAWGRVRSICEQCEHWVVRTGDKWPHCEASAERTPIEYEFLNGPESNCPVGKWKDAAEMDVPAMAADAVEQQADAEAAKAVALIQSFGTIPSDDQSIRDKITALCSDGQLTADVAAKLETKLIDERDAASV